MTQDDALDAVRRMARLGGCRVMDSADLGALFLAVGSDSFQLDGLRYLIQAKQLVDGIFEVWVDRETAWPDITEEGRE